MTKTRGTSCALLLVLLGSLTAYSQPSQRQAYIPFDFLVGRHMLPAGPYRVLPAGADVRIESLRGIAAVTVPADTIGRGASRWLNLVFEDRGRTRELVRVYGGREIGRELAGNPSQALTVIVAKPVIVLDADNAGERH